MAVRRANRYTKQVVDWEVKNSNFSCVGIVAWMLKFHWDIQGGREISVIIVTEDYLCYKEPKRPYNFFLILIFNELFKLKISDERQHWEMASPSLNCKGHNL